MDKSIFDKLDELLRNNRNKKHNTHKTNYSKLNIQRIRINPIQPIKRTIKNTNKYDLDDFKNSSSESDGSINKPKNKIIYTFNVKRSIPLDELDWETDTDSHSSNK